MGFSGSSPEERAQDVLLEQMLDRTVMFGKGINMIQQKVDNAVWHWFIFLLFAGLHRALPRLIFTDDAAALVQLAFFIDHHLS